MLTQIFNLMQGKTIPILMLLISAASAGGASFITHSIWKAKYLEVKLELTEGKVKDIQDIYERHQEKQAQVIADYHAALDVVNSIVQLRNSEQERAEQKYRSLYAQYVRLQRQNPTDPACDIDAGRSNFLVLAGQESNQTRARLAAAAETKGASSVQPPDGVPDSGSYRRRRNSSG